MRPARLLAVVALAGLIGAPSAATADWVQTWNVDPAHNVNKNGKTVAATVVFSYSSTTGYLTIDVTNDLANPGADNQSISALFFTLATGQTSASLLTRSAVQINVNSDKSFSTLNAGNPVTATAWSEIDNATVTNPVLGSITGNIQLTSLGVSHAPQTIIGLPNSPSNKYDAANPSITNGVHSPFLYHTATFVLDVPGLSQSSRISSVTWGVGTATGNNLNGNLVSTVVPEPSALALAGIGMAGLLAIRLRRRAA
jgi:hypothetical protein